MYAYELYLDNKIIRPITKAARICLFYYRSRIDSRINSRIMRPHSRISDIGFLRHILI